MLAKYIPVFFVVAVFLVSACVSQQAPSGGQPGAQPPGGGASGLGSANGLAGSTTALKEFRVAIAHTSYNPNVFSVDKGDVVRFLANAAKGTGAESGQNHNHGITIDEYGINKAVTTEDTSKPVAIEFTADKAGEFRIYCKTCWDGPFGRGHPAIEAKLIVKG